MLRLVTVLSIILGTVTLAGCSWTVVNTLLEINIIWEPTLNDALTYCTDKTELCQWDYL